MPRALIAFDATMAPARPTGGSYYALNLIQALARADHEHDYVVFVRQHSLDQLNSLAPSFEVVDVGDMARWRRYLWEQTGLPLQLGRRRAALLHSPHYTAPLFCPCPRVVTVHDLTFFLVPQRFTPARRLLFQAAIQIASRRSRAVIVPSRSTADDLRVFARTPADKVHVTYEGVSSDFRPLPAEECAAALRSRFGLAPGYLLSLGTREPGKNREAVYAAFKRLCDQGRDLRLVVVGGGGWRQEDEVPLLHKMGLSERVHFTGYVPQSELPAIYGSAAVFLFPSLHEGFGLAALEAMACGTPVVAANTASLPEVVGDAGLLVDPHDVDAIAAATASVLDDNGLAGALRKAGPERARRFSWEECAAKTVAVYRHVLGESTPTPD